MAEAAAAARQQQAAAEAAEAAEAAAAARQQQGQQQAAAVPMETGTVAPPRQTEEPMDEEVGLDQSMPAERHVCSSCLCEIEAGEEVAKTPCGHVHHAMCLEAWMRSFREMARSGSTARNFRSDRKEGRIGHGTPCPTCKHYWTVLDLVCWSV